MNFPGYKYLGPGNKINFENPVNEDDRIALLHDLAYVEFENNPEQIHVSDLLDSNEFIKDFVKTGNWHTLVEYFGLSVKWIVEGLYGSVIYPPMQSSTTARSSRPTNRGNKLFKDFEKRLSNRYKSEKRPSENYQEFQKRVRTSILEELNQSSLSPYLPTEQQTSTSTAEESLSEFDWFLKEFHLDDLQQERPPITNEPSGSAYNISILVLVVILILISVWLPLWIFNRIKKLLVEQALKAEQIVYPQSVLP